MSKDSTSEDLHAQVLEFLWAFELILKDGFLEGFHLRLGQPMAEGVIYDCAISIWGCVPRDRKYWAPGCGAHIDANTVIALIRQLADRRQVKRIRRTIQREDWLLRDEEGVRTIGSKGERIRLFLSVEYNA